jgi:hypothetical protein
VTVSVEDCHLSRVRLRSIRAGLSFPSEPPQTANTRCTVGEGEHAEWHHGLERLIHFACGHLRLRPGNLMRYSPNDNINQPLPVDLPRTPDTRHSQAPRRKTSAPLYLGIGLAVFVLVATAAALISKPLRHQIAISIVRQPTTYTQLYFSQAETLPKLLTVDKKNTIDFTIVNDENRTYRYTYTVTLADSRSHSVVSTETVSIGTGDGVTRPVTVTPKDRKTKYLVTISLKDLDQSIHFYAETS